MIRRYTAADKAEVIRLLRLNTPMYFAPSEENDLAEYLDHFTEDYYVAEENGEIAGAGGINYFPDEQAARLSWDVVHPAFQGIGIGRQLTLFRIHEIKKNTAVQVIIVRTTQLVYSFYEKMGFELEKTERDFWAPGFDLYRMKMKLF